jgi:hypothetical protein
MRFMLKIPVLLVVLSCLGTGYPEEKEVKSDPRAVDFLMNAETLLYSPVREGLQTLSFSRPLNTQMGALGVERYYFKAPDRYGFALEVDDPEIKPLLANRERSAAETLSMYLGTFITLNLDQCIVQFLDRTEDSVRVRCRVKKGSPLRDFISMRDLIFDPDGRIQSIKYIYARGETQTWKVHLKKRGDLYLLDRLEMKTAMEQGSYTTVQRFVYEETEGFLLVIRTEVNFPELKSGVDLVTRDLEVNQPIEEAVFKKKEAPVEPGD